MTDVRRLYTEKIDAARLALSRNDRAEAAAAFHAAIYVARSERSLEPEVVSALVHLGKLEQELGRPAEAERVLDEALETGERCFGAEHPSLGAVLNELSRLHIRQSHHARAEAMLERLLRITRAKGEQHPDVATALAGLALVKRALGDHAAAEQRFREALRIRESALAPHHMATVVTLEQLSETCAARGNVSEALALLQRALPTRQAALGADHATVRALHSRIAALELRVLETMLPSAEDEIISATPLDAAADTETAVPAPATARTSTGAWILIRSARLPRRKLALLASAGVAAVALTVGMDARPGLGGVHASTTNDARFAIDTTARTRNGGATLGVVTEEAVLPLASHSATDSSIDVVQEGTIMLYPRSPAAPAKLPVVPKNLSAVTARLIGRTNVDSMVRASTTLDRALSTDQIEGGLLTSSHPDDASARSAVLVGPAPRPRFPDELRSHWSESEVVVRFRVDERGRVDVSSMKVLKSDHELFTAAVRSVLSRFRFEPARSPAPESKPISDWVDFRVQFAATT